MLPRSRKLLALCFCDSDENDTLRFEYVKVTMFCIGSLARDQYFHYKNSVDVDTVLITRRSSTDATSADQPL